jgi:biotin transport system substrate-specific component
VRRLPARDLALVAVFAALIAALGLPGSFTPFGLSVPITAQTLGVMLAGLLLGALAGPSAGYLVGWVAGAYVTGLVADVRPERLPLVSLLVAAVLGGIVVVYLVGIPVLAWRTGLPITTAITANWAFVPGDLAKAVVAAVVARGVERGYPLRERRAATRTAG